MRVTVTAIFGTELGDGDGNFWYGGCDGHGIFWCRMRVTVTVIFDTK